MIRYIMAAGALKLFSTCSPMKRIYRLLGNKFGAKRRAQRVLPQFYVDRAKLILRFCEKHHVIKKGDKVREIGTGWLHWESIILRLFYDVEITLSDVWDNRQIGPLKRYFAKLAEIADEELDIVPTQYEPVHNLLRFISSVKSFDDMYHLLGFQYVIEKSGMLSHFGDESFSALYSGSVLEHINKEILSEYIQNFYRLLKPGGYSIHTIDMGDHLSYYDPKISIKTI